MKITRNLRRKIGINFEEKNYIFIENCIYLCEIYSFIFFINIS